MPTAIEEVKLWRTTDGAPPQVAVYPEAASQSYKRGDFVYLASGKVTAAVAPGSNLLASGNAVMGIAGADASGVTDTNAPVIIANENLEVCLPVTHATPASAITAITQVGVSYELENVTGKGYAVAIDDTGSAFARVTEIAKKYPVGEQYGWVWCKPLRAEAVLP